MTARLGRGIRSGILTGGHDVRKQTGVTKMENNTGEAGLRALSLQQAQLVLQEEDLQILVAVGAPPDRNQVDEERYQMREHEPEHEAPSVC